MTDERTPKSPERAESGQDEQVFQEMPASDAPVDSAWSEESRPTLDADAAASTAFEGQDQPELIIPPLQDDQNSDKGITGQHSADSVPSRPTLGDRIKAFMGIETDTNTRMYSLTHAISIAPEAAVNYVLRGELYLERGQYNLAAEDFSAAVTLAESDLQRDARSLGLLAQSIQDRALAGYEEAIRRGENGYNKRKSKVE